jgi:exosortase A-associated hydrolase 1
VNYVEKAITFNCEAQTLVGILTAPQPAGDTGPAPATGVVLIVGGPQYRAGSHRQFVLLSRALAAAGYPVLRFDYRGMGDSTGEQRDFLQITPDIASAIDSLQQQVPSVTQVALWGLCDAASAALLYWHDTGDKRVRGLCLLNPWVRSEATLARAHVKHYYADRLRQKEFWLKLLSGRVASTAARSLWQNLTLALRGAGPDPSSTAQPFQRRMAGAWQKLDAGILLLLSGKDYTAKEFLEFVAMDTAWIGLLNQPNVVRQDLLDADHTFSDETTRTLVEILTLEWLARQGQSQDSAAVSASA